MRTIALLLVVSCSAAVLAGCSSTSSSSGPARLEAGYAMPKRVDICHGYSCGYRSKLVLHEGDGARFKQIMSAGAASPAAERAAIANAVRYFEERAYSVTGVRDQPRAEVAGAEKGQMDCVDESTNTTTLLTYLAERGMLRYHNVERKETRGFFLDGRYPHWTAVVSDPDGVKWVVDSWYAPMGGAPDIITLKDWKPRGYLSSGALDS